MTHPQSPKLSFFLHTKDEVHTHVASMYHASQSEETKLLTQSKFGLAQTELKCLRATIAFGMICAVGFMHACSVYTYAVGVHAE